MIERKCTSLPSPALLSTMTIMTDKSPRQITLVDFKFKFKFKVYSRPSNQGYENVTYIENENA